MKKRQNTPWPVACHPASFVPPCLFLPHYIAFSHLFPFSLQFILQRETSKNVKIQKKYVKHFSIRTTEDAIFPLGSHWHFKFIIIHCTHFIGFGVIQKQLKYWISKKEISWKKQKKIYIKRHWDQRHKKQDWWIFTNAINDFFFVLGWTQLSRHHN